MTKPICQICQSENVEFLFYLEQQYAIHKCSVCQIEFLHPQLDDVALTKLYSENYYKAWGLKGNKENESIKSMKIDTFNLRLDLIQKYFKSGSILDVGCATGYFLEAAQKRNYKVYGVELSGYSAQIAQQKFGKENIFNGTLEQAPFANEIFDIIAMSDLIEHIRNPIGTLKRAKQLLKPGGIIMIITPNTGSLSHKIMRSRWTHYKLEHFFYFNKSSIDKVSQKAGLKFVHFEKAVKALNIDYFHTQLNVYKHKVLSPLLNLFYKILPSTFTKKNFQVIIGEMVLILKKES